MHFRSLFLGAFALGWCAFAQADPSLPPPLAENLVGDCTFTDPLESTPWQAESGALADMLCPSGGCGNCAEQVNMLRFRGRDTDDVLAVRQEIVLPAASSFDLSFDLKYCDTRPTGTVSFSLGNFDVYTITVPTRPTSGVRSFVHTFDNSGDSPVQPAGLAELVIANPALDGADIMVDNVRLVPRFSGSLCTLDPALFATWQRKVNGGEASQDTWTFNENGTFYLDALRGYYDEANGECCISGTDYNGVWCVDNSQTPPAIYLRVDSEGYYESKSAKAEKVFEPDCGTPERAWYGRYQIDGGQLSLRVQECPNPTFDAPPVYAKNGSASDNGSPLIAPCETPEGEGTVEAENTEGETCPATPTADPAVVGSWGQKCGFFDGTIFNGGGREWNFYADGTFTSTETQYGDELISGTSRGTYTVNTSVSPAQMDLHTCETCFDDVFDEIEGCDVCCSGSDYQSLALYTIEGDILRIATGTTRPEILSTIDDHRRDDPEYCPANGEGEGPVDGEAESGTEAENGNEAEVEEGEGAPLTCESGGPIDPELLGPPFMYFCFGQDFLTWVFSADGTFLEENAGTSEGPYYTWLGTYSVDLDVTPHRMRLHYCHACTSDDVADEYEAECPPETLDCRYDMCEAYAADKHALYEVVDGLLTLVVAETPPATLDGAVTYSTDVDDICLGHIEGEGEGETCPDGTPSADPAIVGTWNWECIESNSSYGNSWTFNADGTFILSSYDNWDHAERNESRGTYSVDTSTTPHQINLLYCEACFSDYMDDVPGCDWCCSNRNSTSLGIYAIEGTRLKFTKGTTRPETFRIGDQFELSPGAFCSGDYSLLVGTWGRGVCDKDLEQPKHQWTFLENGVFVEEVISANSGSVEKYQGFFEVNIATDPPLIDLDYRSKETYDDVVEEGEPCNCGGGCHIDSCEQLDFTKLGVFEIVGTTLNLVTDDCRPASTDGALAHTRDGLYCVTEEALGEYNHAPGTCQSGPSAADVIESFIASDTNTDRALSEAEAQALNIPPALFSSIDYNDDGFLTPAELLRAAGDAAPRHTSDQDLDGEIDLAELLRAIQFYNAGGYSCAPLAESEDGYLPQPFGGAGVDPACAAHASDYNPADGKVSLSELLRIIQLFNASNYTACPGSGEDGFCLS